MRFSRPCYDKYHRCPGWAGGGLKFAKKIKCDGGYITVHYPFKKRLKWRFASCNKCDVIVFPYHIRWIDPSWWKSEIKSWLL